MQGTVLAKEVLPPRLLWSRLPRRHTVVFAFMVVAALVAGIQGGIELSGSMAASGTARGTVSPYGPRCILTPGR